MRHILNLFVFLFTLSGLYAQNSLDCSVSPPEWIQGVWLSVDDDFGNVGYEFTSDELVFYSWNERQYYSSTCEMHREDFRSAGSEFCMDKFYIKESVISNSFYQVECRLCGHSENFRFERIDDFTIAEHFVEGETRYYRKQ